ncbi:MFS transporter [Isoptericola sp. AK164]|uniref:MFS transporter n=1 Tax=Isoptericola sp. AK164 TaxID=3024246 RepID=UPI0024187557|nr:MFS transporter [Isoptericola sp. AK164]
MSVRVPATLDADTLRRRLVALSFLRWFPTGLTLPVTVLLLQQRGLDLAAVGLLVALHSAVTVALELPTGGVADVVGRRPVLTVASALSVLAAVLLAVGTSLPVLGAAMVLLGAARALDSGPLQAWYVDHVQALDAGTDLRPALGRTATAESLGLGAGALLAGGVAAVSLPAPFVVAAVVGVVHLVLVRRWVTEGARPVRGSVRDVLRDVPVTVARGVTTAATRAPLRRVALVMGATGVALAGVELLAPGAVADATGGEQRAAAPYAVLVTLGFCASAVGSALAARAARVARSGSRAAAVSTLLAALALGVVGLPTVGAAVTGFLALYLLLGIAGPLLDDLAHRAVSSRERATALSVNSLVLQAGGAAAAVGLGVLVSATSRGTGLATAGAVLALGALALVRWPRAGRGHAVAHDEKKVCQAGE